MAFKQFWMVWCPQKGKPNKKHECLSEAKDEAKSLAKANPGYEFFVLNSIGSWMIREPEPSWEQAVER
jgi:hypothetical protein